MSSKEPTMILGFDVNDPQQKQKLADLLQERIKGENMQPKEALELSDDTMEYLYKLGYYFYTTGQFTKALDVFRHLTLLDHKSYKYAFGMAAVCHQLKNYEAALISYYVAYLDDVVNPIPLYYASDCLYELGQISTAEKFCSLAVALASDFPEYGSIKEEAQLFLQTIQKKLQSKAA